MGADPRLPKMPAKPTLIDFFKARFATTSHLLQSATHALKGGIRKKLCSPAFCTTSGSRVSSAAITATGARR